YRLAALQGHAHAMNSLGACYAIGAGVLADDALAVEDVFANPATLGYPRAQAYLGVAYARGRGVEQSSHKAVEWYRLGAAQGDAEALFMLGGALAKGHGAERDASEALKMLHRAA
ncbi:hypothetical protein M885DRAFT_413035, partial [Pelagophyceae sp. CCMP2097]